MFKAFGKYSVIIMTTALFLASVITVLGLNFYMSFQVEANAEAVNVAGRQRMLSQRVSKSLLNTQVQLLNQQSFDSELSELKGATNLFNTTLRAFQFGGEITGTSGQKTYLPAVKTDDGKNIIGSANKIWKPFHENILKTITSIENKDTSALRLLSNDTQYARDNINSILKLMNDLTNERETIAQEAATRSRLIQAVGIVFSLICFIIIMYRIFGQLRVADAQAERAEQETQQIFSTVNQGLFLLDKDFQMGEQHSQELENIFADTNVNHQSFTKLLEKMVSASDMDNVKRYMKLLFDPHKKQTLIADLNPLNEVSIQVKKGDKFDNKFLRFNFRRVYNNKEIERVLTSVSDITREIKLAKELERESRRSEKQLEMISAMMDADRTLMPIYLKNSDNTLDRINDLLKAPSRNSSEFKQKARTMMSTIHGLKGESAALSLNNISELCHEFESDLKVIIEKEEIDGHDFVEPTVVLNKLMSYNTTLNNLFNSIFGEKESSLTESNIINWSHLHNYTQEVAKRQNKEVNLQISGLNTPNLDSELVACINTISTQLVRNAISHGIENTDERMKSKKNNTGTLSISLFDLADGGYRYIFNDDGGGINFESITERAIAKGLISRDKAKLMSKSHLINLLFTSDLSTSDITDEDKGRGVGMSSILQPVKQLGGRITVKTNNAIGTTFMISFPKELSKANLAAA